MGYFSTSDGTRLYYTDEGGGTPVILVHGWLSSLDYFDALAGRLRLRCRCIRYDQRGHGRSETPFAGRSIDRLGRDLRELIEHLDLHGVLVVGHSMGALAVYSYVDRFGCLDLSALAVMDMSPKPLSDASWPSGALALDFAPGGAEGAGRGAAALGWQALRPLLPYTVSPLAAAESFLPRSMVQNHPPATLASLWFAMLDADYRGALRRITVPSAYLQPEEAVYPPSAASYFASHVAGPAFVETFPGSSHITMGMDVPRMERVVDRLLAMAGKK